MPGLPRGPVEFADVRAPVVEVTYAAWWRPVTRRSQGGLALGAVHTPAACTALADSMAWYTPWAQSPAVAVRGEDRAKPPGSPLMLAAAGAPAVVPVGCDVFGRCCGD
jgi:hypothetical protein